MSGEVVSLRARCVQVFGEADTERILVEVASWLHELADLRNAEADAHGHGTGMALIAASDAGVMHGLARAATQ